MIASPLRFIAARAATLVTQYEFSHIWYAIWRNSWTGSLPTMECSKNLLFRLF